MTDSRTPASVAAALAEAMASERLRIVASLIRTTGDWDLAEDALADAAERALTRWPIEGVPDRPAAWLTVTARRRAIDLLRRRNVERTKLAEAAMADQDSDGTSTGIAGSPGPLDDDRLGLIFTCCHPALPLEARVALTLKVVAGLSTEAIGRAFLTSEATMGQRLLRAKRKIAHAGIPFRVPAPEALPERIDGVLAVVYLIFTEGYATGDTELAGEAIRLGRLVAELLPHDDEARNLLALMLLQHARRPARIVDEDLVTLAEQDRSRWNTAMIAEGLNLLGETGERRPYRIQAELAAAHSSAPDAAATDWVTIVALYDELLAVNPSPVVALNRAVAVAMSDGPLAGVVALEAAAEQLPDIHLVAAARGELLAQAGRTDEAAAVLHRAAEHAPTERERRQLERRRSQLTAQGNPGAGEQRRSR